MTSASGARTRAPRDRAARRNYVIWCVSATLLMAGLLTVVTLMVYPE